MWVALPDASLARCKSCKMLGAPVVCCGTEGRPAPMECALAFCAASDRLILTETLAVRPADARALLLGLLLLSRP